MATSLMNPVIQQLRRAVLLPDGAGLTDGQLLESFVSQKDESAFEVLVRRHGPMVLGVCRRVLRNHHDGEDAFQATFLVLARKGDSIVPREMVANWLYGVAYRTALKARSMIAKQRVRERQVTEMPEPEAAEPDNCWRDLKPLLDQELSRLPDKYRVPVVFCDLEGKTGKEAARQLGWPEGTVSSRLARGRTMLAKRLTRHGLTLSGGSLAVVLSENAASASVPTSLVSSTVKAASLLAAGQTVTAGLVSANVAALTEGVLKTMLWSKLKTAMVVILGVAVFGVTALLTYHSPAAGPADGGPTTVAKSPAEQPKKVHSDLEKLQGTWTTVSSVRDGQPAPEAPANLQPQVVIKADKYVIQSSVGFARLPTSEMSFKVDQTNKPKEMDFTPTAGVNKGKTIPAIYSLEGDELKICFGSPGGKRPTEFVSQAKSGTILVVFKRGEPGKTAPAETKPQDQDQGKQILDMVLKGFQAYQDSKGGREQRQDPAKRDLEKLQGTWRVVSSQVGDKEAKGEIARWKVTIKGDLLIYEYDNEQKEPVKGKGTIKLDPKTRAFDWTTTSPEKATILGIYELKGDNLKIGFGNGVVRPRQFVMGKEDVVWLLVLKRDDPNKDMPKKEADASAEQERTIAAVKELGGHVLIDRGTDSTSTIKVILSETDVKDKDLERLKGLPMLQELYLFRTKITGEGLKHLKGLTRLQRLDLSHCTELTEAGLANLKGLTKLQTLDLTATGIGDADLKRIKNLTDLEALYLRFNSKITDVGLKELKGLTKLQTLVLDRTEISDAGLKHLSGLTKLRTLHLANAQLTDGTLEQLKGFSDLRSLSLMGTKATNAGLVHLKGLTELEELYLDGTQVTDAGLDNLAGLTKLRTLSLRLTKTTGEGVKGFNNTLPKVKVIR